MTIQINEIMKGKTKFRREWNISNQHLQIVSNFLSSAYSDYLAARILLNNKCLLQGAIQANTCIEKYFKALIFSVNQNVPRNHSIGTKAFLNTIMNKFSELYHSLNIEFIQFLSKGYQTRYLDELPTNFNYVIVGSKTLLELDRIVNQLEFSLNSPKLNRVKYHNKLASSRDNRLFLNNTILNTAKPSKKSLVFEMRKFQNGDIIQLTYEINNVNYDGKFIYEGLRPISELSNQYKLCFS